MENPKQEYIGCLSLMMYLSLAGGLMSLCANLFFSIATPSPAMILTLICGATSLLGVIFLLQYKKVGFYLYVASCLIFVFVIICYPEFFKRDYQYSVLLVLLVFLGLMAIKSKKTRMNGYQTIGIIKSSNTMEDDVQDQIDTNEGSLKSSDEPASVEENNTSPQNLLTQDESKESITIKDDNKSTCEEANDDSVKDIKEDIQQENAGNVSSKNDEHSESTQTEHPNAGAKEHKKRKGWIITAISLGTVLIISGVICLTKCERRTPDEIFRDAKALIDNNQYEKGIAELEKIQENYLPAKALLGGLLTSNDSVNKDLVRGEKLLWEAFEKNDTNAGFDLIDLYYKRANWDTIYKVAEKLTILNTSKGYRALAWLHWTDKIGGEINKHKDYSKAEYYALQYAEKDSYCCFYLGNMYSEGGYGIKKDYVKAFYWWSRGAELGDADCYGNLGWLYFNGYGVKMSDKKAFNSFKKAIELDSANYYAYSHIANMYKEGYYVKANRDSAKYYYKLAAKYGDEESAIILENNF